MTYNRSEIMKAAWRKFKNDTDAKRKGFAWCLKNAWEDARIEKALADGKKIDVEMSKGIVTIEKMGDLFVVTGEKTFANKEKIKRYGFKWTNRQWIGNENQAYYLTKSNRFAVK